MQNLASAAEGLCYSCSVSCCQKGNPMRQMLSTGQQNNASTGASTGACPAVAAGFSPTSGNTPFHRHWAE